jgi:signal transduction histidine kinase
MSDQTDLTTTVLAGGGEMGALIRAHDWSATPLGPAESWPQSLRSVVSMLLPSKAQIVLFWGPEFAVIYNDAYRPVFGAKHPGALGRTGRDAWSEIWDDVLHALLAGVVRTGEAFWGKDLLFLLARFGFVEETYFDVSYDPVRVESGEVGGVYCIVTETTERVVSARRMALLKDLAAHPRVARTTHEACAIAMETLANHPHDIVFAMVYLDGVLQACTPGAEEKRAASAAADVHELALVAPTVPGPPGRLVVGRHPWRPFDTAHEAFLGLVAHELATAVASAHAYEQENRRAEALAELDRAKTAFFSNVSHEFRTPLTLILGPIEDLLAAPAIGPAEREQVALVHRNSLRLLKLVNTLLDFSRLEAGRLDASFEPTNLAGLTADLASAFRSAIERAGMELVVHCAPLGEPIYVDRDMWEKIVLNLLSNAFKYTRQGRIKVSLSHDGSRATLAVADTGVGIPERERSRVFERFHRIEGVQGRTYEGTGIGLALVKELVQLHGGVVSVESVPGAGSTFSVSVPLGHAHLPADRVSAADTRGLTALDASAYVEEALRWLPERARTPDHSPGTGPDVTTRPPERADGPAPRILIADDNADMREYLVRLLREHYDVETVADGRAALESARRLTPDLILADVMMPEMDGFGLLSEVRRDATLRTVPVLLLSARAGEEARVEGWEAGADDYLVKPFSARELVARVATHLRMARIRRDAERVVRQSEEQLREADRRKDEFLATLAHELRNPLAPIRTGLEIIRLGGSTPAAIERVRAIMERQIGHMVRLIDDLLDISRITSGKIQLKRHTALLSDLVEGAVEANRLFVTGQRVELSVHLPETPYFLEVDRTRFVQILSNLLHNAAKFTAPGGHIDVSAAITVGDGQVHPWLALTVADSGIGISEEMLPRVFDLFSQEEQPGRDRDGLGIGLALVRRLVDLHGGRVEVTSEGRNRGTQVTIYLPLARAAAADAAAPPPVEARTLDCRVLIVDDNDDAARTLAMLVGELGGDARVAGNGADGIERLADFRPDIVLLDIGMSGIDGYETCRRMRQTPGGSDLVIVALTGWGQEDDKRQALEAGFDRHLTKPADPVAVEALLEDLDRARALRALKAL